jgi:DNA-binding NarL/FixJ family response regulator
MSLRILIADDAELVRQGIAELLARDAGPWKVCGMASDGRATLELAQTLKPDVVLLDLSIPLLSGQEVAARLRNELPTATVVLMSARDPSMLRLLADAASLRHYVPKSQLADKLIVTLSNIARERDGNRDLGAPSGA